MNKQGFHVSVKPVTKGNGGSVIAKSAYNSGSKLEDKKANKISMIILQRQQLKILN